MANSQSHPQIYVFGKGKIDLRQFVIFNCQLSGADKDCIEVLRAYRQYRDDVRLEKSNIAASVSASTKTVHLEELFLTHSFGLSIRFKEGTGSFVSDPSQQPNEFLEITTEEGTNVRLLSFLSASKLP
jgi:hypothetical protein